MRDNVPLVNTTRTTIQHDGSLIIHPYKREDAGNNLLNLHFIDHFSSISGPYVCNATNKKESATQVAHLEVKGTDIDFKSLIKIVHFFVLRNSC